MYFTEHELEFLCVVYVVLLIKLGALSLETIPKRIDRRVVYFILVTIAVTSVLVTSVYVSIVLAKEIQKKEKLKKRSLFAFVFMGIFAGLLPLLLLFLVFSRASQVSTRMEYGTIGLFLLSVVATSLFYTWEFHELQTKK